MLNEVETALRAMLNLPFHVAQLFAIVLRQSGDGTPGADARVGDIDCLGEPVDFTRCPACCRFCLTELSACRLTERTHYQLPAGPSRHASIGAPREPIAQRWWYAPAPRACLARICCCTPRCVAPGVDIQDDQCSRWPTATSGRESGLPRNSFTTSYRDLPVSTTPRHYVV